MSGAPNGESRGTVDATACPWCTRPVDFRGVEDFGLEVGNSFQCDHCQRYFEVARVKPVTVVWLRRRRGPGADPATDIGGFAAWLERRGRSSGTCRQYSKLVRRLLAEDDGGFASILDASKSPMYRHNLCAALRSWATYSRDAELLERLADLRLPARLPKAPREPLSRDEWFALVRAVETADYLTAPMRAALGMIAIRGMRCGDVVRLTRSELAASQESGVLALEAKGGRRLEYSAAPLEVYIRVLLDAFDETHDRVRDLLAPGGAAENRQESACRAVRRAMAKVARREGWNRALHAHLFRHTYVRHFLSELQGDPEGIVKLQDQMGWSRLETAGSYMRRARRKELDALESNSYRKGISIMASEFVEIDRLRDPDDLGLVAPITVKTKPNGYVAFSFAIFKEFERAGGATQRSAYLNDRHIEAAHKLLDAVERRIEIERDKIWEKRRRER